MPEADQSILRSGAFRSKHGGGIGNNAANQHRIIDGEDFHDGGEIY
jgi:hypothetical protein